MLDWTSKTWNDQFRFWTQWTQQSNDISKERLDFSRSGHNEWTDKRFVVNSTEAREHSIITSSPDRQEQTQGSIDLICRIIWRRGEQKMTSAVTDDCGCHRTIFLCGAAEKSVVCRRRFNKHVASWLTLLRRTLWFISSLFVFCCRFL